MQRRPPRSTRTDTLFPYTTLFRSDRRRHGASWPPQSAGQRTWQVAEGTVCRIRGQVFGRCAVAPRRRQVSTGFFDRCRSRRQTPARSEEPRVGQECVSTCRTRRSQYHSKNKIYLACEEKNQK